MDRMSETQAIGDVHVGWPIIFPEVPEFLSDALSFFASCAQRAHECAHDDSYFGSREVARGQAYGFNAAADWIADNLASCMWCGDGNALVWVEAR